jgi:hypothetical protein
MRNRKTKVSEGDFPRSHLYMHINRIKVKNPPYQADSLYFIRICFFDFLAIVRCAFEQSLLLERKL